MVRRILLSFPVTITTVLVAIIAAAAVLWPAAAYVIPSTATSTPDPATITDYKADYRVDSAGRMTAVETITTQMPCCDRHGIFRYWDVDAPWDDSARLVPKNIEITRNGLAEDFDLLWQNGRKYRVAKIGSADRTLSMGVHTYEIRYTVDGVLAPTSAGAAKGESSSWGTEGDGSVFYWDVVAGGWQMQINQAEIRVTLPTPAEDVKCTYGFDSSGTCQVSGGGTDGIVIKTGALGPRTPVTLRATQTIPVPGQETLPWAPMYDGVLGQSLVVAAIVLGIALLGLIIGRLWEWSTREDPPGYPVMYEPPPGLGPVQTYFLMKERIPSDALISTLLYQAERGLTKLTQAGDDWTIEGLGGDWTKVDQVTRRVGEKLGVHHAGGVFSADGSVSAGQQLTSVQKAIGTETRSWARDQKLLVGHGSETLGRVLVVVAAVIAAILIFVRPAGITLSAIPFAAFSVAGIGMLRPGVGTRRTQTGRDLWSRSGGFYRLLSTTSAQDRFDFSAHKELYTAYIPFAVAFDCADKWAEKYVLSTGQQPPQPTWYAGPGPSHGHWGSPSSFAGFESSLRSSIGAYEATQSSSSSGGGGFSGGGGGGGGGGGSW